jgi:tetratricopeptide (TPR) repeat protein
MTAQNHALDLAIRKYEEKLKSLEETRCPTFLGSLPLTMVEIILGTGQFFYRLWMSIINIPIVGAPLHLADDFIQLVWFVLLKPCFIWVGRKLSNIPFQSAGIRLLRLIPSKVNSIFQSILSCKIFKLFARMVRYVKRTRPRQNRWQTKVIDLLISRDELEHLLGNEDSGCDHDHLSSGVLKHIIKLDDRLRGQSDRIFRTRDLERLQEFRKPKAIHWWWNINPPRYRLDWLWQTIIYASIIGATSFGADVASRFFTGGDFLGIVAVVGPALLAILIGKESFSQISAGLEDALKKLGIPKRYWRESILIFILMLFILMGIAYSKKPEAAICYYHAGRDLAFLDAQKDILDADISEGRKGRNIKCSLPLPLKLSPLQHFLQSLKSFPFLQHFLQSLAWESSNSGIVEAESYLKTASAFDPDNRGVSFALGYLYELQQDFDNAKKYYKAAMRNGSRLGQIRWAKLLLRESNKDSAALAVNVLLQNVPSQDTYEDNPASSIAWKVAFATARLRQNRVDEAKTQINEIWDVITSSASKELKKDITGQAPKNNETASKFVLSVNEQLKNSGLKELDIPVSVISTIDCIRNKISPGFGESCLNFTNPNDLFEDELRGQIFNKS